MGNNNLTDRSFWVNYWESKPELISKVKLNTPFDEIFKEIISESKTNNAIELGGFPGYYSIYLKKFYNLSPTLLDYFIHRELLGKFLNYNDLSTDDVKVIEADLFAYEIEEKYDLVLSMGLIEHFQDTENVILKHVQFLNEGGKLFITIPNFRGVNGWVQKTFDPHNYEKHNIDCMDTAILMKIAKRLGLRDVKVYYYGKFSTWLEDRRTKTPLTRTFVKAVWVLGKLITRVVPVESRLLSPYIILEAKK